MNQAQSHLDSSPLQMSILIGNVDYWRNPERRPFPSKKELTRRINFSDKAIQNNIGELEQAGLVRRGLR